MNGLEDIQRGVFLPKRKIWVEWGASYEDFSAGADRADNWLPHGHNERYGQLHWHHECLLPLKPDEKPWDTLDGGVIGFVRGGSLTVRQFWLSASDTGYHRQEVFQYQLWMSHLAARFGEPELSTNCVKGGSDIVPSCRWHLAPVTISLSYAFFKNDPLLNIAISHEAYPL